MLYVPIKSVMGRKSHSVDVFPHGSVSSDHISLLVVFVCEDTYLLSETLLRWSNLQYYCVLSVYRITYKVGDNIPLCLQRGGKWRYGGLEGSGLKIDGKSKQGDGLWCVEQRVKVVKKLMQGHWMEVHWRIFLIYHTCKNKCLHNQHESLFSFEEDWAKFSTF